MTRLVDVLSPRRRYHDRKPVASALLRFLDLALLALPTRSGKGPVGPPRRILLMNPAYIGDVLLATSVIPSLRRAYPGCEIGFLVGSWSAQVVTKHPLLDHVHVIDVFRLNRSRIGPLAKLQRQAATQRQAEREIRALNYDLAIDLFTGFPPLSWFAWKCGIPRRLGYMNRGFGALLTESHSLDIAPGRHEAAYYMDLAVAAGASPSSSLLHPRLGEPGDADAAQAAAVLGWQSLSERPYIVIHPGTGERLKEWPVSRWRELVGGLVNDGHQLVFTGHGPRDTEQIEQILEGCSGPINLCGRLAWPALCALVRHAVLLIGVDSMSGHLASSWQVPTVTLSTGMSDPQRWRPASAHGVSLHTNPPCLPCLGRRGCESMRCIRDVSASDVLEAIHLQTGVPS